MNRWHKYFFSSLRPTYTNLLLDTNKPSIKTNRRVFSLWKCISDAIVLNKNISYGQGYLII